MGGKSKMKRIFENNGINFSNKGKYQLHVGSEGINYESSNGKKSLSIKFADVGSIVILRYLNSNSHYTLIFRNYDGKNMEEIDTDVENVLYKFNNMFETKSILIAFAENKLTEAFPDNLDTLNLQIGFSLKEKEIRLKEGVIVGVKHQVKLSNIRRVKCASNGTLSNLLIYQKEKGGFLFDKPDMKIPLNELTLPIFEAIMAKNNGKGIDFSMGNGFDQKTSEYIIERYMNSTFFMNADGSVTDDWHRIAYEHIAAYKSDVEIPENIVFLE
ncbi:MAG: hypothetical protein SOR31_01170 [Parvimonas sp.]|uniref:hypothetical protein n=1 Tax=Parvimonas sp. TaxID=1944660 RepID=UPI002A75409B|nr:hypothetical protein [Parvimonas sp.]MDY3050224.1 hypothetical protein [Parvimonas sp.]